MSQHPDMSNSVEARYAEAVSKGLNGMSIEDPNNNRGSDGSKLEKFYTTQEEESNFPPELVGESISESDHEKIRHLLKVSGDEKISHFRGWLGKDVTLQGSLHLTKQYLLFYAHLPPATLDVLKSGPIDKKGRNLIPGRGNYTRLWFVLRMGSLSWYANAADKYFPVGLLPLHLMERITHVADAPEKFVIKAYNGKSYTFRCDSRNEAHVWIQFIRREMFRAKVRTEDFRAVVRIPLANVIKSEVTPILDIADLLNIQVVASSKDPKDPSHPLVGNYSFVFFGTNTPASELKGMIEGYTDLYANNKGVSMKFEFNSGYPDVDFAHSKFGHLTEDMLDTTPPSAFRLYEGTEFGSDKDILASPGLIKGDAVSLDQAVLGPGSSSGADSKSGSGETSGRLSPSASVIDLQAEQPKKRGVLSTITHKLSRHKDDESTKSSSDLTSIMNLTTVPFKLLKPLDDQVESDDEDADVDYESKDVGVSVDPKFNEDKVLPFLPENFCRKVSFQHTEDIHNSVETTHVEDPHEVKVMNAWLQDFFGLEPFVKLHAEYICKIQKPGESSVWEGKLLVSNLFLCFQRCNTTSIASGLTPSSSETRMAIPMSDIIHFKESPEGSTSIKFEVSATAYGVFDLRFSSAAIRADAESLMRKLVKEVPIDGSGKILVNGKAPDFNYIEYDLRTARLSTYEPSVRQKLRARMPPLFLDPSNPETGEKFLNGKPKQALKFVMLMIGSRGDVQPYIALSQGLMKEGHKCCIVTHKEFEKWVTGFGIEFREIAGDPRELMEIMISHGSISYSFIKDALHHFKNWLKELMKTAWIQIKDSGADVMLESPSSMIGLHIAEALDIPYFRAFTMPWTRTKSYPQALIMPDQTHSGTYNSLTYVMYERAVWFAISRYVNKWRKKYLNLPSTDLDSQRLEEIPFLYCVSPTVLVPPIDQPDWVHTCGYWELQKKEETKDENDGIDEKLVAFLEEAKSREIPVAYIGFGSIIVDDPEAMTQSVVDATRQANVHCVLARGWSARSTKGDKKKEKKEKEEKEEKKPIKADHVFEVDSVDHQWLFPRVHVCVHHGGSGTTGASLRAGRPTVIKPFFGDQFFYGSRVEDLGVGVNLKQLTTSGLADALKKCVSNKEMIRQADVLGEQIRREDGVTEAILSIYREYAYATDVTTRRRARTAEASKLNILHAPVSLLHHDSWMPKKVQTHRWSKHNDDDEKDDGKDPHKFFSMPKFGHREHQRQNNRSENGEIDVSL